MSRLDHQEFMVAIEAEPRRRPSKPLGQPEYPSVANAEQLLAHLSSDLADLIPAAARCSLTLAAALFDQSQLLRPGYPVFSALRSLIDDESSHASEITARRKAIVAGEGAMPHPDLQPTQNLSWATLQFLPLLISGRPDDTASVFDAMEHVFLEKGRVSAHSATGLQAAFDIEVRHARFMTLTDLMAMFQLQLQHFGFSALWELVNAALDQRSEPVSVSGSGGQQFRWDGARVLGQFETFDYWASEGGGRDLPADSDSLDRHYGAWTREYRQYLLTLRAHDVRVDQHLPGQADKPLAGSFLVEEADLATPVRAASITEHSSGELGTIAVTVVADGRQVNFYPLTPEGLNEMHAHIRETGCKLGNVAYPGAIHHDPTRRRLTPERLRPPA